MLELYIVNRLSIYLTTIQKQIDVYLKTNAKNLSSVDIFSIEKNNTIAKNNIEMMNQNLSTITLKQAHDNAIVATKHLEKSLTKLQMGDKTNVLIQQNIKLLDNQILRLTKGINDISNAFSNILKYFGKKDPLTTNKIRKLVDDLQAITLFYQRLGQTYKEYGSIDRREFLNNIYQISKQIINWKNELINLMNGIFKQYKQAITVNDELAEDYFGKYSVIQSELNSIKKQAVIIMESSGFDETLKTYAQRMIFFLNKYRNEAPQIKDTLEVAENYYKQKKYQETIDMLIEVISNISDSAKSNKILFN